MAEPRDPITTITSRRPFYWITSEPWLTFESNRAMWWTTTNLVGKVFDEAGTRYLDATPAGRALGLFALTGIESFLGYFSHEFAHMQDYYNMGGQRRPRFEMTGPGGFLPKPVIITRRWCETDRCDYLQEITGITAGINQQEFNAQLLSGAIVRSDHLPPDLALSYLLNRSFQSLYTTITMNGADRDKDPVGYRGQLNAWNRLHDREALSKEEHLAWPFAATLLSGRTLDSLWAVGAYLARGERDYRPIHFDINGTHIYPPDFQVFWHPDGLLLSADLPIRNVWKGNDTLMVNVATGVAGGLQVFRIGGHYGPVSINAHPAMPTMSLGYYLSIYPDAASPLGMFTQLTLHWSIARGVGIDTTLQVSHRDPIETDIKGVGNYGQRIGIPLDLWREGHAFWGGNNAPTLSGSIALTAEY